MTNEEYIATQMQLAVLAQMVEQMNLTDFIAQAERADAIAPVIDPTLWMKGHKHLDAVKDLARAGLAFQGAAAKFKETMAALKLTAMGERPL